MLWDYYLAQHHIEYGSPESIEFTNIYFMLMNYWTLVESNNIARERQTTFAGFEKSQYADGTYFDKYVTGQFVPKTDRVKELFEGHFIPQAKDWEALRQAVMKDGLYHQNRLAVAPNGSISYINDCSASIHPITQRIEERQEKKIGKIYYSANGLSTDTIPYYTSAYDMDMRKMIDVYAAATEHVDQGLSMTLFLRVPSYQKNSTNGKLKANKQPVTFQFFVIMPTTKASNQSTTSEPLPMMVKKSDQTNVKAV